MLVAIDGNNSLRRMPKAVRQRNEDGKPTLSQYIKRADGRSIPSDMYLSNAQVDKFKNEVKKQSKVFTL